ncbi:alpha/beta fold hydrolase [Pendulispora albinea]|uniref:Alpha/beta hydrolase n=1 Tax=Pendulispora albinea TaxID=2741071 RepID=A0ABZ2M8D0_9BACT
MAETFVRGVKLHFQRVGVEGAPTKVVFLHGLVMDNLSSWYFTVANAVAAFADVVLYDLRGHGMSDRPASGYTADDMVLDLCGVLDATVGDAPVILVGNSYGAFLAVQFALRHPARVAGLVLVDGHLGDEDFGERMAGTLSLRGEEADRAIASSFQNWLGRHSARKATRLAALARALVGDTSLVRDLRATPPLAAEDFARITAPALALYGERSDLIERSAKLVGRMPRCTIHVFAGCTHSILWEATNEVRGHIVDFCRVAGHAEVQP